MRPLLADRIGIRRLGARGTSQCLARTDSPARRVSSLMFAPPRGQREQEPALLKTGRFTGAADVASGPKKLQGATPHVPPCDGCRRAVTSVMERDGVFAVAGPAHVRHACRQPKSPRLAPHSYQS